MKALDAIYRWSRSRLDAPTRVLVAFAMVGSTNELPNTWACLMMVAAVLVQVLFAVLVAIADFYHGK